MPRVSTRPAARTALTAALTAALAAGALAGCGGEPGEASDAAWVAPSATPEPPRGAATAPAGAAPGSATPGSAAPTGAPAPGSAAPGPSGAARRAATPAVIRYAFPVRGNVAYHPTHGKYPATDIFAPCGAPVVAAVDGTVLEVSRTDEYVEGRPDGPRNGGLSVSLLGADGVRYYGSHLSRVAGGIDRGVRVRAGQALGAVGRTGNANNVCHLHFGISPPCAQVGDWKVRRGVVWPKPYLDSWRKGGTRSAAAEAEKWAREHGCRA